jgi:hypothetical protein
MTAQMEMLVLDFGLSAVHVNCTHITICASEPTTYALAAVGAGSLQLLGYASLGAGNCFGAPATISGSLRAVTSPMITSTGTITTTGTAAWWAAVDEVNSVLYAHGSSPPQAVNAGNSFSMAPVSIIIPMH